MSALALPAGAGLVFGAALTASEVYLPSVIMSQMQLKDYHMLSVFLSASACSAYVVLHCFVLSLEYQYCVCVENAADKNRSIVMATFERLDVVRRQPRKESSIGWYGPYDANVLGGVLVGVGMTLTGACPGTVVVQLATGIKSGIPTAVGGLVGGILFARLGSALKRGLSASTPPLDAKDYTIYTKFDINPDHVLLGYEILCLALIGGVSAFGLNQTTPLLHPMVGGALIGGAQAASLILTGNAVGVSTAYEEAGRFFWYLFEPQKQGNRPPTRAMSFALGIFLGSFALSQTIVDTPLQVTGISAVRALLGGCAMVFGARLAGGCTSGHGISGMSSFSISSIITVIAMFGGGILMARLVD